MHRLTRFAQDETAVTLYQRAYARGGVIFPATLCPLLYVPSHPARTLDRLLQQGGIPKVTIEGKVDFHACRVTYINLVLDHGATVKEAQALARHTTPDMTMTVYARTRQDHLAATVERVAASVAVDPFRAVCVPDSNEVRKEGRQNTLPDQRDRSSQGEWRRRESNPRPEAFSYSLYMLIRGKGFAPSQPPQPGKEGASPD